MKHCNECNVDVKDLTIKCPLCGAMLIGEQPSDIKRAYPPLSFHKSTYVFVKKILLFLSVIAGVTCLIINFMHPKPFGWGLIVVASLIYAWIVIPHVLRKGGNYAGKIFTQVMCVIALIVFIDFGIGWSAWSVSYVVPIILCVGITAVALVVMLNSTNWAQYVMYQIFLAALGFAPIVLYVAGISKNWIFALIPSVLAASTILGMIIFGDRSIKNEFKRRLRF